MPTKNLTNETAIFGLWLNWVLAGGALCIPSLLSVYAPAPAIPFVTLGLAGALLWHDRRSIRTGTAVCPLVSVIATRALFYTAIIMMAISLVYKRGLADRIFDASTLNHSIPYITLLILAPVVLLCSLWSHIRGREYSACQRCAVMLGPASERGFLGKIFTQESRYQRISLAAISTVLTVLSWGYYLLCYVNVNINLPDRLFFGWMPVILYGLSVVYLAARCFTLWAYYCQDVEGSEHRHGPSSTMRVIIIHGEYIYLHHDTAPFNTVPDSHLYDTPATLTVRHTDTMDLDRARQLFSDISQIPAEEFNIRFLYESTETSGHRNAFHFICSPTSREAVDESLLHGQWFSLPQVERLLHGHDVTPALAAELHRIYTVAMAWKTYDANGRRLYKVKNYRPMLRLAGIMDWDVDFNSTLWLKVARLNQDRPFWRLRRLMRRLYTGNK